MADWSGLHTDLLMLVAKCLKEVPEHLAFAAVCSSWRSVALQIRPTFPRPVPGLMLPGFQSRIFFSLSDRRLYPDRIHLLDDDVCVGSHGGWLFIMHKNFEISLYNPFSGERLCLPPMTSFPKLGEADFVLNHAFYVTTAAVSSQNINKSPKDATVMVAEGGFRRLAFAKPGDSSWHLIKDDPGTHYTSIVFYKGQFYAVGKAGLVVCDIGSNPKSTKVDELPPSSPPTSPPPSEHPVVFDGSNIKYLVELAGELVLVERWMLHYTGNWDRQNDACRGMYDCTEGEAGFDPEDRAIFQDVDEHMTYKTVCFSVFKMDFTNKVPSKDLGNQVIFVGLNTAFLMPAWSSDECIGDCIYYTDDLAEGLRPSEVWEFELAVDVQIHLELGPQTGKSLSKVCNSEFLFSGLLIKHVRKTHKQAEVCNTCTFVAASHGKLEEHITADHTPPPRPFVCPVCKMHFSEVVLFRHIPSYHLEVFMEQEK